MFIQVLSTRHTDIGTLRFGVVYEVDEKEHAVRRVVKKLMEGDNPAVREISAKKAKELQSAPVPLQTPSPQPEPMTPDAAGAKAVEAAKAAQVKAETGQKEALEKVEAATAAAKLQDDEIARLKAELAEKDGALDAAVAEIASLKDAGDGEGEG